MGIFFNYGFTIKLAPFHFQLPLYEISLFELIYSPEYDL